MNLGDTERMVRFDSGLLLQKHSDIGISVFSQNSSQSLSSRQIAHEGTVSRFDCANEMSASKQTSKQANRPSSPDAQAVCFFSNADLLLLSFS